MLDTMAEPQGPPVQAPPRRRRYPRPWFVIPAAVLGLVVACGGRHFATETAGPAPAGALWRNEGGASLVVGPDGTKVFVTGAATVAYRAATGARLWAAHYRNLQNRLGGAALAVSPDGRTVFATGEVIGGGASESYATVAYRADTGARLWAQHYAGGGAHAVAVSPDGTKVFVAGGICRTSSSDDGGCSRVDHVTVAYRADTGGQLWVQRYADGGGAHAVAVSPDGRTVFVTGGGGGSGSTVAYRANTGAQLWAAQSHIGGTTLLVSPDGAALAVSPDGRTVFVAGFSQYPPRTSEDYATVAYHADTGKPLWAKFYGNGQSGAEAAAISPDGRTVFVTGRANGTVAYRAGTGDQLWATPFTGGEAWAVVASPDGTKVFVAGNSFVSMNTTTVAYNPATGAQLWAKSYGGGASYMEAAVSPDSSRIFVTGSATVAYPAG